MMKKITALFLALLVLCAAPALADSYTGETEAKTTVELALEESYTLTIPPTLAIPFEQEETELEVKVSGLRLLAPKDGEDRVLLVKSASAAGELKNANGDALPYTLTPGELVFRAEETQSLLVRISPDAWSKAPGGEYTGAVTFSMECVYRAQ